MEWRWVAFDFILMGLSQNAERKIFLLKLWLLTMWYVFICVANTFVWTGQGSTLCLCEKAIPETGHRGVSGWIWPLPLPALSKRWHGHCSGKPVSVLLQTENVWCGVWAGSPLRGSSRSVCCAHGGHFPSGLWDCASSCMDIGRSLIRLWIWFSLSIPPPDCSYWGQGPLLSHWFPHLNSQKVIVASVVSDSSWSRGL